MGLFDNFVDETGEVLVQLKVGPNLLDTYETGQTVSIPDGVYVGHEGVVAIVRGKVAIVTSHLHDKWGGWISPGDVISGTAEAIQELNEEEQCVFCNKWKPTWEFHDGLRCDSCVEEDEKEEES